MDNVVPQGNRTVRLPQVRENVMHALGYLADSDYQQREWTGPSHPLLDYVDYWLFDGVLELPDVDSNLIGEVLFDEDEQGKLVELGSAYWALLDDVGVSNMQLYVTDSRWPNVVRLAGRALATIVRNGGYHWCARPHVEGSERPPEVRQP